MLKSNRRTSYALLTAVFSGLAVTGKVHSQVSAQVAANAVSNTSSPVAGATYAFKVAVMLQPCNFDGSATAEPLEQAPAGSQFYFVRMNGSDAVVQFLLWPEADPLRARLNTLPGDATTRPYHCLSKADFESFSRVSNATKWASREGVFGALLLPVKLRPGSKTRDFDFSKDLSIGTTGGLRMRISDTKEIFVSALVGTGVASVSLNAENTGGTVTAATDRAAFTWTTGGVFEVDKIQFGLFVGADHISNNKKTNWIHNGRPWYAIGLGYSVFGSSTPKPATGEK